jgi:hypothetical protein
MNRSSKSKLLLLTIFLLSTACVLATPSLRHCDGQTIAGRDLMDTRNFRLRDYRRMFRAGQTPTSADLVGRWRGVNKGIVELAGYKQFIKEILPHDCELSGDNIMVHQVSNELLRCCGWQAKSDPGSPDGLQRKGKFAIRGAGGIGPFRHGVVFSYRQGNNRRLDPVRLIVDRVVKIDDNHLLGRVTANFGPLRIPLAYFVLERI